MVIERKLPLLTTKENYEWYAKEDVKTPFLAYKIEISKDKLIALFSIKMNSAMNSRTMNEIYLKIKTSRIVLKNISSLDYVLKNIDELNEVNDLVLSIGSVPNHGSDAKIEILFKTIGLELPIDSVEKVDYKSVNKVVSVKSGDILGRYIQETLGEDGADVFGQKISAYKGKPCKFIAGKNVVLDRAEMVIKANADGIPSADYGEFKIEPALMVEKDLDLSVGNLDFKGSVSVNGDVLDGFSIIAGGDIYINGVIGACKIISSGKIIVHGGVAGKGKCSIECKELFAKFLHESHVEAQDRVFIQKEVINSETFCSGKVEAAVIIGGRTIARDTLEVSVLGSEQNVETIIEVGSDFKFVKQYEFAIAKTPELDSDLAREMQLFQQFIQVPNDFFKLESDKQKKIGKLFHIYKGKVEIRMEMESKIDECLLAFRLDRSRKKTCIVQKFMYENVKFVSHFSSKKVEEVEKGPLAIKENYMNRSFTWSMPL